MRAKGTAAPLVPSKNGVLFVSGYATSLKVQRGHLVVRTGAGADICEARIPKVGRPRLRRLIVFGKGGGATFEALSWLQGVGAGFASMTRDAAVVAISARLGTDIPALRRAQARALDLPVGIEVSRMLLSTKVDGQARVLGERAPESEAHNFVRQAVHSIGRADSIVELRQIESAAAAAYWGELARTPMRFARADLNHVPSRWVRLGQRASMLSGGPRLAISPPDALLNYLYALAEIEARLACLAVGLDPGIGIVHADQPNRDSLALDLMEVVRHDVDRYVLALLDHRTFSRREFGELPNGACRIGAPLASLLSETMPAWAQALAPFAERVAKGLARSSRPRLTVPTRLTETNRSRGRGQPAPRTARLRASPALIPSACRSCGLVLDRTDRMLCDDCLTLERINQGRRIAVSGPQALAMLRSEGRDPAHGGKAGDKRADAVRRHAREAAVWDSERARPASEFREKILPLIREAPLPRLAVATGLSIPYCGQIRRGLVVPHPRHWEAFLSVARGRTMRNAYALGDSGAGDEDG